jgi:hypothetical protein
MLAIEWVVVLMSYLSFIVVDGSASTRPSLPKLTTALDPGAV